MKRQKRKVMGSCLVVSHGNLSQAKQCRSPLLNAQVAISQNGFSLGTHPSGPPGHPPAIILGQRSQAMPQTPIRISMGMQRGTSIQKLPLLAQVLPMQNQTRPGIINRTIGNWY
jgi:hypothetical protein